MPDVAAKRRFIKDPVWGNIELLPWEADLLNHFFLNRLHNVIQNSSGYRVYPGLRHSRFVHSVGVLHVATQLFINVVINSPPALLAKFAAEAKSVKAFFPPDQVKQVSELIAARFLCPLEYSLLLGIVRISALLHDCGHLPYSHIFEFALHQFIEGDYQQTCQLLNIKGDPQVPALHKELQGILHPDGGDAQKPHEVLGHKFIEVLVHDAAAAESPWKAAHPFLKGANALWTENKLPIAQALLEGDIDADRIDFVRRDGFFSGLYASAVDYGRLFSFYELATREGNQIGARPSSRASSESEKLLQERFLDYRYIAAHHKVHLFDELMERFLLRSLLDGSLNDMLRATVHLCKLTGTSLSAAKKIVEAKEQVLLNFDDSAIDRILRKAYVDGDDSKKELAEDLAERRDLFASLFKADGDYERKCEEYPSLMQPPAVVAAQFKGDKYKWEQELREQLGRAIIIGDVFKKLSSGIKSLAAAKFFGLTMLTDLLDRKFQSAHRFNVWYARGPASKKAPDEPAQIEKAIIAFLAEKIS